MFRRIDDFITCWKEEAAKTLAVLEAIPDGALGTTVTEGHRDLRRMAWHLVESLLEMPAHCGLKLEGSHLIQGMFITEPPTSMAPIREAYAKASDSFLAGLQAWNDGDLETEDEMYGERWQRGRTLFILLIHQTHHRGQMTVLMRQAGLRVPDVYGPAKEGWAAYGMEAPKV
jgi:uncharacterized damage-inducible protein DinB